MTIILIPMLFGLSAQAQNLSGPLHVVDGDSLKINDYDVRLFGIDAPETDQTCTTQQGVTWSCGSWVRDRVRDRFQRQHAVCAAVTKDRYDRFVAKCHVSGADLAKTLVSEGWAFAYRRYSMDYDLIEKQAAVQERGLHAHNVQSPAQFRKTRIKGRIAPDPDCKIKGNISAGGARIFHVPGQADYERTGINLRKGERWFCSASEARRAGWRAAKR